jgi:hypothetical protein
MGVRVAGGKRRPGSRAKSNLLGTAGLRRAPVGVRAFWAGAGIRAGVPRGSAEARARGADRYLQVSAGPGFEGQTIPRR